MRGYYNQCNSPASLSLFSHRKNRNLLFISSLSLESYDTVRFCVQSVVFTNTNVYTGMDSGAALSVKNISGFYKLSVCSFRS